jgi:hypothetical protein
MVAAPLLVDQALLVSGVAVGGSALTSSISKREAKERSVVYQTNAENLNRITHDAIKELNWHINQEGSDGDTFIIKAGVGNRNDIEFGVKALTPSTSSVYCVIGKVWSPNPIRFFTAKLPHESKEAYAVIDSITQKKGIKKISGYERKLD